MLSFPTVLLHVKKISEALNVLFTLNIEQVSKLEPEIYLNKYFDTL